MNTNRERTRAMNYRIIDKDIEMYEATLETVRLKAIQAAGGSKLESFYLDQIIICRGVIAQLRLLDASFGMEVILKRAAV